MGMTSKQLEKHYAEQEARLAKEKQEKIKEAETKEKNEHEFKKLIEAEKIKAVNKKIEEFKKLGDSVSGRKTSTPCPNCKPRAIIATVHIKNPYGGLDWHEDINAGNYIPFLRETSSGLSCPTCKGIWLSL